MPMGKAKLVRKTIAVDGLYLCLVGLGIFLFVLLLIQGPITTAEILVFRFFNDLPDALWHFFAFISLFGTLGFVMAASLISLVHRNSNDTLKYFFAGLLTWLAVVILKSFEFRYRPNELISGVTVRDISSSSVGYPSGHAAIATALGLIAFVYMPSKYRPYVLAIVALVCVSRLYLGMHLPLDVIGGSGVGLMIAGVVNFVFNLKSKN